MKLLLILPSTHRGGNEKHALTIAEAAVRQGGEVHAAFPESERTRSLVADIQKIGAVFHPLPLTERYVRRLRLLRVDGGNFARTLALLKRTSPDVVMINLPWPTWGLGSVFACAWAGIPTAVVFQLVSHRMEPVGGRARLYRWAFSRKQEWIAVSENNRTLVGEIFGIPRERVRMIYNGTRPADVDCLRQEQKTALRKMVRDELGLPEDSTIVLTVGRLDKQKGYALFLPLIADVVREFPRVRFVWVGDGEQRETLERELVARGVREIVLLLAHRDDVPRLLHAADLFVLPTYFEGHPFSLLEAMAHGVPIIASDAGGIPEVIDHTVHGLLFPAGNADALRETLRHALEEGDCMQAMARAAAVRANDFSEGRMVSRTMEVLHSLAALT